jgi:serine/threonine protein kinase
MAPELMTRDVDGNLRTDYDSRVDMWSLGVLLHAMMFRGLLPFSSANDEDADPSEVIAEVLAYEHHFDDDWAAGPRVDGRSNSAPPSHDSVRVRSCVCPQDLMRLLGQLLQLDPGKRPSSGEVLRVPAVRRMLDRRNEDFMFSQGCDEADDSAAREPVDSMEDAHDVPRVQSIHDIVEFSEDSSASVSSPKEEVSASPSVPLAKTPLLLTDADGAVSPQDGDRGGVVPPRTGNADKRPNVLAPVIAAVGFLLSAQVIVSSRDGVDIDDLDEHPCQFCRVFAAPELRSSSFSMLVTLLLSLTYLSVTSRVAVSPVLRTLLMSSTFLGACALQTERDCAASAAACDIGLFVRACALPALSFLCFAFVAQDKRLKR